MSPETNKEYTNYISKILGVSAVGAALLVAAGKEAVDFNREQRTPNVPTIVKKTHQGPNNATEFVETP